MTKRINVQCRPTPVMCIASPTTAQDPGAIQGSDAAVDIEGSDSTGPLEGSDS